MITHVSVLIYDQTFLCCFYRRKFATILTLMSGVSGVLIGWEQSDCERPICFVTLSRRQFVDAMTSASKSSVSVLFLTNCLKFTLFFFVSVDLYFEHCQLEWHSFILRALDRCSVAFWIYHFGIIKDILLKLCCCRCNHGPSWLVSFKTKHWCGNTLSSETDLDLSQFKFIKGISRMPVDVFLFYIYRVQHLK